jgi:hypothetical protein
MTGREIRDAIAATAAGPLYAESFERMAGHLDRNGVDLGRDTVSFGAPLEMDVLTERFISNDSANRRLARQYRQPFVVPDLSV